MASSITGRRLLTMQWRDVFFAHWPLEPGRVATTLPNGLEVDTRNDQAWLGIVGFEMADVRPRYAPIGRSFHELNLRTYVRHRGQPGVYFYNLDADDRLGVAIARRLFDLPYYLAEMEVRECDGTMRFRSRRRQGGTALANVDAKIEPRGTLEEVESESLAAFLLERYRFFVADRVGTIRVGEIDHDPWVLQDAMAAIYHNTLFAAAGFDDPSGEPHLLYSPGCDVTAGWVHGVE